MTRPPRRHHDRNFQKSTPHRLRGGEQRDRCAGDEHPPSDTEEAEGQEHSVECTIPLSSNDKAIATAQFPGHPYVALCVINTDSKNGGIIIGAEAANFVPSIPMPPTKSLREDLVLYLPFKKEVVKAFYESIGGVIKVLLLSYILVLMFTAMKKRVDNWQSDAEKEEKEENEKIAAENKAGLDKWNKAVHDHEKWVQSTEHPNQPDHPGDKPEPRPKFHANVFKKNARAIYVVVAFFVAIWIFQSTIGEAIDRMVEFVKTLGSAYDNDNDIAFVSRVSIATVLYFYLFFFVTKKADILAFYKKKLEEIFSSEEPKKKEEAKPSTTTAMVTVIPPQAGGHGHGGGHGH